MKKLILSFLAVFLGSCLLCLGCGQQEPSEDADWIQPIAKGDEINPTDKVGIFVVHLPDGFETDEVSYRLAGRLYTSSIEIMPETHYKITRDSIELTQRVLDKWFERISIDVPKKQTTHYQLAAMSFDWDPEQHQVDFGNRSSVRVFNECNSNNCNSVVFFSNLLDSENKEKNSYTVVIPGTYRVEYSPDVLNEFEQTVVLEQGSIEEIVLDADKRGSVTIHPPQRALESPQSTLPFSEKTCRDKAFLNNESEGDYYAPLHYLNVSQKTTLNKWPGCSNVAPNPYPFLLEETEITVKAFPLDNGSPLIFSHYVNGFAKPFEIVAGENTDVYAGRIDVNPVEVSSGEEEIPIQGSVIIEARGDGMFYKSEEFYTQEGIDVVEGLVYKVKIVWRNEDDNTSNLINWTCDYTQPPQGVSRCTED